MKFASIICVLTAVNGINIHSQTKALVQTKAKVGVWDQEENLLNNSSKMLSQEETKIKNDIMAEKNAEKIKVKETCAKLAKEGEVACAQTSAKLLKKAKSSVKEKTAAAKATKECQESVKAAQKKCEARTGAAIMTVGIFAISMTAAILF